MSSSVFRLFEEAVLGGPKLVALSHPIKGKFQDLTWKEVRGQVSTVAQALLDLGIGTGERVAIMSKTRLEWTLLDLGILEVCACTVPLYHSINDEDFFYILKDSASSVLFLETEDLLQRFRTFRNKLPNLRAVVVLDTQIELNGSNEMSFGQFLERAKGRNDSEEIRQRLEKVKSDDVATIVYTSGTTGEPKGAMITHDNLLYEAHAIEKLGIISSSDIQLIFLPLAHIFARILEMAWLKTRHVLVFAEDFDRLSENIKEIKPTVLAGVPRVFEKIHASIINKGLNTPGFKKRLVKWAFEQADAKGKKEMAGDAQGGLAWSLAEYLVFSKIRENLSQALGGRLRFLISGGAALSPDINYFFKFAGVTILEGWGLTETSAATCLNIPTSNKIGTVGKPVPGTELKIAEDGEILVKGRGVFKGYWQNDKATHDAFDEEGFFKTGDVGIIHTGGFLKITDRKKDVIVTAGGKKIAPQKIENLFKSSSGLIAHVLSFGDKKPYLVGLFTLEASALFDFAKEKGLSGDYKTLTQHPDVKKEMKLQIDAVNAQLSGFEQIKKFAVLDHDFVVGDQLTPTLKVKRRYCEKKYASLLESFYAK